MKLVGPYLIHGRGFLKPTYLVPHPARPASAHRRSSIVFAAVPDARIHQHHGSSCSQTMIHRCTRMHPLRWPAPHRDQEGRGMCGLNCHQYRPYIKIMQTYLADRGLHRKRNHQGQRSKRPPSLVGWRTKSSQTHRYLP